MSADAEHLPPEEQYTVGQILNDLDPSDSASPPPSITMNRHFPDNPFLGGTARAQFVSDTHDAILKQFSSSQFRLPSVNHVMTPSTQQLVDHISDRLAVDGADVGDHDSGSSTDDARDELDVDDSGPLVFEFPYVSCSAERVVPSFIVSSI